MVSASVLKILSICAGSIISGGDSAITSPVQRTSRLHSAGSERFNAAQVAANELRSPKEYTVHDDENDQHQRGLPAGPEEQVHGDRVLIVQREGEQNKKNGCIEQPRQVFQIIPSVVGRL